MSAVVVEVDCKRALEAIILASVKRVDSNVAQRLGVEVSNPVAYTMKITHEFVCMCCVH